MIFLVQINYTQDRSEAILPLGILSIGTVLKKGGYQIQLININEKQINQAVEYIVAHDPAYVGFSVMTGMQTQHSALMSRKIREKSDVPIVWGGIHPSLLPEQCLKEDYIDYVVIGEGEETIIELTEKILDGDDMKSVFGLGFKENNRIIINEPRHLIADLSNYPLDWSLINLERYIFKLDKYERVIAYKSSRGCPFNCAFCYNYEFNQRRWRAWPAEQVINDINFLKEKYNIDAVKFYDDNFFVDKERAFKILKAIEIPAHTEIRIDAIDEDTAKKLKEFKSFDLLIGMESGNDRLLKMINKNITVKDILKAVQILSDNHLTATYSTMVGLPTETKEEFFNTIDLMYQAYNMHPQARFTLGAYMPYPGSKLYQFAVSQGFIPPQSTEEWGKMDRFRDKVLSPWVNPRYVWRIREYFKFLSMNLGPIRKWLKWRIRHHFFMLSADIYILEYLSHIAIEEKGILGKTLRKVYNYLRK